MRLTNNPSEYSNIYTRKHGIRTWTQSAGKGACQHNIVGRIAEEGRKEGRKEGAEYKMTVMTRKELRDKQSSDSPAKAEESQVEAQQSGHHMSDERTGLTGVEVDPKPHSHQQGEQLTRHKVYLHTKGTHTKVMSEIGMTSWRLAARAGPSPRSGIAAMIRNTIKV